MQNHSVEYIWIFCTSRHWTASFEKRGAMVWAPMLLRDPAAGQSWLVTPACKTLPIKLAQESAAPRCQPVKTVQSSDCRELFFTWTFKQCRAGNISPLHCPLLDIRQTTNKLCWFLLEIYRALCIVTTNGRLQSIEKAAAKLVQMPQ